MRTTACMAVALALLCSAGAVSAQESKAPPSDLGRNAALTYWRAFAAFPELTKEESSIVAAYRPGFRTEVNAGTEGRSRQAMGKRPGVDARSVPNPAVQLGH